MGGPVGWLGGQEELQEEPAAKVTWRQATCEEKKPCHFTWMSASLPLLARILFILGVAAAPFSPHTRIVNSSNDSGT